MASNSSTFAISSSLLLTLLLFTSQIQPSLSQPQISQLIWDLCEKTIDFKWCTYFFYKNVPYGPTYENLAEITIRKSLINATDTSNYLNRLVSGNPGFEICRICYSAIVGEYVDMTFLLNKKNYNGILTDVGRVVRPVNDCLQNANGSDDIYRRTKDMKIFTDIARVLMNALLGPH